MNALSVLTSKDLNIPWADKLALVAHQFMTLEQISCPVEHSFKEGQYIREMRVPRGTLFIGRVHKKGHEVILSSGHVILFEEGNKTNLEAPFGMKTKPGYQIVFFAVTDVVGHSIHENPGNSRDTEAIEAECFESAESLNERGRSICQHLEAA